jgi:hypothetical protein
MSLYVPLSKGTQHGVSIDVLPTLEPEILAALESGFRRGRLQARQLRALVWRALVAAVAAERARRH